jgi:hypothetical protein
MVPMGTMTFGGVITALGGDGITCQGIVMRPNIPNMEAQA